MLAVKKRYSFFASHGFMSLVGVAIAIVLFAWYGTLFMEVGYKLKTNSYKDVLIELCGKYVGNLFDWILTFFIFGVLAIMISGGGSALNQYFGISLNVGKVIISVAALVTVLSGFQSQLNALGFLSPLMILATLAIAVATILSNLNGFADTSVAIAEAGVSSATPFWWSSAMIYVSYCVLPAAAALATIGKIEPDKSIVKKSGIAGGLALGISLLFMILAILSNYAQVANFQIPFLEVARLMHPVVGLFFTFVLLAAIYTTTVPILYSFVTRFTKEGTKNFTIAAIVTTIVAFIAGLFPFSTLVGTVYPLLGYMGLVVMAFGIYWSVSKKNKMPDKVDPSV